MSNERSSNGAGFHPVEYDLHGLAGIRLLNATPADSAVVDRQIGPIRATLNREPDIIIRFVDSLSFSSPMRYLGVDDTAFTDDAFVVLRSKHKARARVKIPFDYIGRQCEIVCERGLPAVPLLIAIINLTVLGKGALPMHASAFTYNGSGVLVTGWAKGGKTETVLAFIANGAEYVGDEWIYISQDGQRMYGIPEPIRIWDWHLNEMPAYRSQLSRGERLRLKGLNAVVSSMDRLADSTVLRRSAPGRLMRRMVPILQRQQYVHLAPQRLFSRAVGPMMSRLDKVFFVASHELPDITVQPMNPEAIARRMVFSLQEERADFMSAYLKFRFAFPEARNELIECAEEIQRDILQRALAGKEAYSVYHPYPVSIPALYDAIHPFCKVTRPANVDR